LAVDDTILDAHYRVAKIHTECGGYEAAAESYGRALELAPYSLKYRYELALVYEEYDRGKAIVAWENFIERAEVVERTEGPKAIEKEKVNEGKKRLALLRAGG
jgi:tetratricopeptide (TPR) repeat protein